MKSNSRQTSGNVGTNNTRTPEIWVANGCSIDIWLEFCFHLGQCISCAEWIQFHTQKSSFNGRHSGRKKTIAPEIPSYWDVSRFRSGKQRAPGGQTCQMDGKHFLWVTVQAWGPQEAWSPRRHTPPHLTAQQPGFRKVQLVVPVDCPHKLLLVLLCLDKFLGRHR